MKWEEFGTRQGVVTRLSLSQQETIFRRVFGGEMRAHLSAIQKYHTLGRQVGELGVSEQVRREQSRTLAGSSRSNEIRSNAVCIYSNRHSKRHANYVKLHIHHS